MPLWNVGKEETLVRRRFTPGPWVAGRPGTPTSEDLTFDGTRDPVPDHEVDTLPEGERARGQIWLITETPLRAADDNSMPGTLADRVYVGGWWYEVRSVVYYPRLLPHYEARLMRVKVDTPDGFGLNQFSSAFSSAFRRTE